MREIKFRGKNRITGSWCFGYLTNVNALGFGMSIKNQITGVTSPIDPETVGQYTGKKDKTNTEIYGGDLLKYDDQYNQSAHKIPYLIKYDEDGCCFDCVNHLNFMLPDVWGKMRIVGNRFENQALLDEVGIDV